MNTLSFLSFDPKMLKTEERILLAAIKVFSNFPIEIVTLRMIAKEAGVTLSLITYHFKTKENLYREVLLRVLEHMTFNVRALFSTLEDETPISTKEAKKLLCAFIDFFAECFFGNPQSAILAKIIVQEHFSPSPVYEDLYEKYFKRVIEILRRLVEVLTDNTNRRETALLAFTMFGQIIGFRLEREIMVRFLGMTGFSAEETQELKDQLTRNAFLLLGVKYP